MLHCGPTAEHVEYQVMGSQFEFFLDHPFRFFRGTLGSLTGSLLLNPANLRSGMTFKVSVPLKGMGAEHPAAQALLTTVQQNDKNGLAFEFTSQVIDMRPDVLKATGTFSLRAIGELRYGERVRPLHVPLDCTVEGGYWKCQTSFFLIPSDYGFPSPELLTIKARNKITVKGEITFGPKKEEL